MKYYKMLVEDKIVGATVAKGAILQSQPCTECGRICTWSEEKRSQIEISEDGGICVPMALKKGVIEEVAFWNNPGACEGWLGECGFYDKAGRVLQENTAYQELVRLAKIGASDINFRDVIQKQLDRLSKEISKNARSNLREAAAQSLFAKHGEQYNLETFDLDRLCARIEMAMDEEVSEQGLEERTDARYDNQS